jgi:tetratricopeptide (TPR) repeat protein
LVEILDAWTLNQETYHRMTEDLNHAATAEAQVQAEHFKTEGNKSLAEKKYLEAIDMYTRAIELDPDNAVYYSNRSAAFLAQGDSRGKALKDAEKCIELRPEWWKGYSRKGAAEHALQRYDAARATYNQGLKLDPDNQSLLEAAEEAYKAGQLHSKRLREYAKEQERLRKKQEEEEEVARKKVQQEVKEAEEAASKPQVSEEDALLAEFISEVQELEEIANSIQKPVTEEEEKKEKAPVDFGTSEGQLVRLLQPHYKWINLNPFRVLMLDTDATEEDIKQHYRKV